MADPVNKTLTDSLLEADASHLLFVRADGTVITVGNVRAGASALLPQISGTSAPLFVFTDSLGELAVAFLAAQLVGRPMILLPQAGRRYCESIGAAPEYCYGAFGTHGQAIFLDTAAPDVALTLPAGHRPVIAFYTSGSTGEAQLQEKPLNVIEAEVNYWDRRLTGQFDWIAGSVSHQHIYGFLFRFGLPVLSGVPAADEGALSWSALFANAADAMLLVSSPAHLTRLSPGEVEGKRPPAFILSSGGPLPREAAEQCRAEFGTAPIEILGSTETGGVAWRQRNDTSEHWTPLEDVTVRTGPEGELEVISPYLPTDAPFTMGDRVEFDEQGRFLLKGRLDRIAKIEGKRVALSRVETVLATHPLVQEAAVLVTRQDGRDRLSAVAVLTREGSEQLARSGRFRFSRQVSAALTDALEAAEMPKRWRFVASLPRNAQSKVTQNNLTELFDQPGLVDVLEPAVTLSAPFAAEVAFRAKASLDWFRGHFPGTPILPGVAQAHIAVRLAEEIWAVEPASHMISRLKFNRVIQPDEDVTLVLAYDLETGRLDFKYLSGDERVSSGTVG